MAQAYVYSSQYFNSDGSLKPGAIKAAPAGGAIAVPFEVTIPTTTLDDVGDIIGICAAKVGLTPFKIDYDATPDMDTGGPTLDADFVLRVTDKNGVNTDTTLVDTSGIAATFFGAVRTAGSVFLANSLQVPVADDADGYGVFAFKVIAAATTPAQGVVKGVLWLR